MGDHQTSSTTTAPSNVNVAGTANKLLGGIDAAWAKGPTPFNESLYAGLGNNTYEGLRSINVNAGNPDYSAGVNGAIKSFGDTAAGKNIGVEAPGYQTVRNKLSNDVLTSTNGAFNNSGLFGSDNNQKQAASGLADSLGALDMGQYNAGQDRQVQAAGLLPGLFSASQMPGQAQLGVGAILDADRQAELQGRYDLSQRQGNAQTDLLAKLSSILGGNAAVSGTTKTETVPTTPWWQSAISLGLGLA